MTREEENKIITEVIKFLQYGKYSERRKYIPDVISDKGALINGYRFQKELWTWIIWKPTDIGEHPEFKGEPLVKVVPLNTDTNKIADVLNAQPWTYL